MIQLKDISYRIGNRVILDNVSFTAQPGEVLAVLGANGAGKSTLLKITRGELKPAAGAVAIGGRTLGSWKQRELAQCTAVLQQQTILTLPFPVREVVMMGRYPHFKNTPAALDHTIVKSALRKAGIEKLADRNYLELSGGEQQRVHLARVFAQVWTAGAHKTRYLLMDEPGNNLDISHQHHVLHMAKTFAAAGNCVIAILHDLNLALQYADRVLLLHKGAALASGTPEAVLNEENLSRAYDFPMTVHYSDSFEYPIILPAVPKTLVTT